MNFDEKTALEIHSMLINSIVQLAEKSRKEGMSICEPVRYNLKECIANSDVVFRETLNLARALFDKTNNAKTLNMEV